MTPKNKNIKWTSAEPVIKYLQEIAQQKNLAGMARYGIRTEKALGTSIPKLRQLAKEIGSNHQLAKELWKTEIHEARILACFIDYPMEVSEAQMEDWVKDFNSWDLCDQCCNNFFAKTVFARQKAIEWANSKEEFIKRAGFVMMAVLAVHDKKADDGLFQNFLEHIYEGATDERNFVKKAVNWALRQIGERNLSLNKEAIQTAKNIQNLDAKSAKWIAADALRELSDEKVLNRINRKRGRNDKTM
jgi:3-methyladenine DNA glycosylase AlkD